MDQSSLFDKTLLSFKLTGAVLRCRFVSHMNEVLPGVSTFEEVEVKVRSSCSGGVRSAMFAGNIGQGVIEHAPSVSRR
jgi:hypothetical protein